MSNSESRESKVKSQKTRYADWLKQAERDLKLAEIALKSEYFEWSCYLSQQAGEKALKGLLFLLGQEGKGVDQHSCKDMVEMLPSKLFTKDTHRACIMVDQHVSRSRYPDLWDSGYPGKGYSRKDAEEIITHAKTIFTTSKRFVDEIDKILGEL